MKVWGKEIKRTVWVLGLVSFFNDTASEMIYPIVPLFLTSVLHASVPIIGVIEGIAEGMASISKYWFGALSDFYKRRKPFVVGGYSMGAISKVLIGLATSWPLVLVARVVDRLGKGLRTAPRDSILLENATEYNKGLVFGLHRAMDSAGAVVGPLLSLVVLALLHDNLRFTFLLAAVPAVAAVLLLSMFVKERRRTDKTDEQQRWQKVAWRQVDPRLKLFLVVSVIFSMGNSADTFLILNAQHLGLSVTATVGAYVLYNLVQTVLATPAGYLADRWGAERIYGMGLLVFALVYALFAVVAQPVFLYATFALYGAYIAATDGVSKAYIAEFITKQESGTYFGAYYTLTAVAAFGASVVGGLLWNAIAPAATFWYGSVMAMVAWILLLVGGRFGHHKYVYYI